MYLRKIILVIKIKIKKPNYKDKMAIKLMLEAILKRQDTWLDLICWNA